MAHEVLTFEQPNGDTHTIDGYVLGDTEGRTVLLHDDDRAVTFEEGEVGRTRCDEDPEVSNWPTMTAIGLVFQWEPATYPPCE